MTIAKQIAAEESNATNLRIGTSVPSATILCYTTVGATLASVTSQRDAMLPVITASICGPNGLYKRSNVLLDSGAQISLIRSETVENRRQKGRDISVNIVKGWW